MKTVHQRLTDRIVKATKAEKAIAGYMLANLSGMPFETAATLAKKVGVSEPMIGRFCRSLGYQGFKDLKTDLRDNIGDRPWLVGDRLKDFRERYDKGDDRFARSLELEIAALVHIYETARTPEWKRAAERLAATPLVFVAGFQTERGIAQYFANQLQYLRPNVHQVDLAAGNFNEVILAAPEQTCLILFEGRRYSRLAMLLAHEARQAKIPVTLVTDPFCDWGHGLVDELFVVPSEFDLFCESTAQMASFGNLLLNGVISQLGSTAEDRMNNIARLHSKFTGYVGDATGPQSAPL